MSMTQLETMKVKELREYIKQEGIKIPGVSKMKKADLIDEIIYYRETKQFQSVIHRMR